MGSAGWRRFGQTQGHANRGMGAEAAVVDACALMQSAGMGVFYKVPTPVQVRTRAGTDGKRVIDGAIYKAKAVADVLGALPGGRGVAVEVKSTKDTRLHLTTMDGRPDQLHEHQRAFLQAWTAMGAAAYLLVIWTSDWTWMLFPWTVARQIRVINRKDVDTWRRYVVDPLFLRPETRARLEA